LSRQVNLGSAGCPGFPNEGIGLAVIQATKLEPRIMRYELIDFGWAAIGSFLPNKPCGIPRVDDRRVLNGIFWVLRSGTPWRALAAGHDPAVQMIDTSIVRPAFGCAPMSPRPKQRYGKVIM
jgi:Putative transposase of IS4/5 family (DUF4096)